jgi:hypothetical protein
MARRFPALALAVVIVGAPIAATVCQMMCASSEMEAMAGHGHQHSCSSSAPTVGTVVNVAPRACGHRPDDTFGVQQALQLLTAPAIVVVHGSLLQPVESATVARAVDIEHSPPGISALRTPLRV